MKKTLTFAMVHVCVAFTVGFAMTGSVLVGGAIALVEPLANTIAYHLHERFWLSRENSAGRDAAPSAMPA